MVCMYFTVSMLDVVHLASRYSNTYVSVPKRKQSCRRQKVPWDFYWTKKLEHWRSVVGCRGWGSSMNVFLVPMCIIAILFQVYTPSVGRPAKGRGKIIANERSVKKCIWLLLLRNGKSATRNELTTYLIYRRCLRICSFKVLDAWSASLHRAPLPF